MLSGFPGVLVTAIVILEISSCMSGHRLRLRPAVTTMLLLLLLFVPVTYFSGLFARDALEGVPRAAPPVDALDAHALVARVVLLATPVVVMLFFLADAVPSDQPRAQRAVTALYAGGLAVLFACVAVAGYRGGILVFDYGAGVSTAPSSAVVPSPEVAP